MIMKERVKGKNMLPDTKHVLSFKSSPIVRLENNLKWH